MLRRDNFAWLRLEFSADLATPRTVFEGPVRPRRLLNGRNVLPSLVVARTVLAMQCIENTKPCYPRNIQDLQHMRNAIVRFGNAL